MRSFKLLPSAVLAVALGTSVLLAACSQSAPAPSPTQAPAAAPTKAPAAPAATTAPAAPAATAAPAAAKAVDFPQKGKAITLLVPYAAGGPSDVMARIMAPTLQTVMGTNVEVINKPGASSQVGVTELAKSKPDGYMIGQMNLPSGLTVYMDPERKAAFGRKDLMGLAIVTRAPETILVKADSPHKTLKDLVAAAKANPGKVTLASTGFLGTPHLSAVQFAKLAGVEFGATHFDGSAPAVTALQGGHVESIVGNVDPPYIAAVKAGNARSLGVMADKENSYLPGVPTFASQGYDIKAHNTFGWVLPANTPKEVVDVLSSSFQKMAADEAFKKKMAEAGLVVDYFGPAEMNKIWDEMEAGLKPVIDLAKQQQK